MDSLISASGLKVGKQIGSGNFGAVYSGEWNGNKGMSDDVLNQMLIKKLH